MRLFVWRIMVFGSMNTEMCCENNCIFCYGNVDICHKMYLVYGAGHSSLKKRENFIFADNFSEDSIVKKYEPVDKYNIFQLLSLVKNDNSNYIQINSDGRVFSSFNFCNDCIDAGVDSFMIFLQGFSGEQHDFITGNPGSFNNTIEGIKNLVKLEQKLLVKVTIVKANFRNLPQIARVLFILGVDEILLEFVKPYGRACKNFKSVVPSLSMSLPFIRKTVEFGRLKKKNIFLKSIPFCFMKACEKNMVSDDLDDLKKSKKKFSKCKGCVVEKDCGGFYKEYLDMFGEKEFKFLI